MDDLNDIAEANSIEELERRRLALEQALGSGGDDSSDESDNEGSEDGKSYQDSISDEENTAEEDDNYEKEDHTEETGCPVKRRKLEIECPMQSSAGDDDGGEGSSQQQPSNEEEGVNSLKRPKRIPEFPSSEFDLPLPKDWVQALHDSGVPIYMHLPTKVVSLSRPYELKGESEFHPRPKIPYEVRLELRRHHVPLCAIPCEQQRRMTQHRESTGMKIDGSEITLPQAELKACCRNTTMDQMKTERISPDELYEKAQPTFHIKEIMVYKKNDWKTIRTAKKKEALQKDIKEETIIDLDVQNPMITVAAGCGAQGKKIKKNGHLITIVGKTSVTLLNEYVQKVLKGAVEYKSDEVKSSINPYSTRCYLKIKKENASGGDTGEGSFTYRLIGRGSGDSMKKSKRNAASDALKSQIPGIKIDANHVVVGNSSDTEAFDLLPVDDPKVVDYSKRTGRQMPHTILLECLRMNAAEWGAKQPEETSTRLGHQQYELVLRVGEHEAKVVCKSLKDGKQHAAQSLLKQLYPMMQTWGSIFRLFSASAEDKETRRVREEIVRLAPEIGGKQYARNEAVLEALRNEMKRASSSIVARLERTRRLKDTDPAIEPKEEEEAENAPQSIDN